MKKSLQKPKDLRAELKAIGLAKAVLPSRSRRYTDKEIELILEGAEKFGLTEASELCLARDWTIRNWRRRSLPKQTAPESDQHAGYHQHWQKALDLWRSKPGLGPAQIANQMKREGIRISTITVRSILEENGYTPPKAKMKPERVFRYEAARPRELVHMDFKHFYIHKQKAFLLLMQDDYSRFLCGHQLTDSENIDAVIAVFEDCVAKFGRMQTIMTDAGSAFYSWNGINRFQKLMAEELSNIEGELKGRPPNEIKTRREAESKPIVEAIKIKLDSLLLTLPESSLGKAIRYTLTLWQGLNVFLQNPAVPMDTNGIERTLRGPVVGRKKSLSSM